LVFCYVGLQAQKEPAVKKPDTRLVNQKLVQLQSTLKKLETTFNESKALINELQKQKDAINELNKDDMLWLQRLLEKKSQLEQMISNVMKAGSETQNNIANNLKAS
jgi:predicted patatin/cPLA2 family phospholipase